MARPARALGPLPALPAAAPPPAAAAAAAAAPHAAAAAAVGALLPAVVLETRVDARPPRVRDR